MFEKNQARSLSYRLQHYPVTYFHKLHLPWRRWNYAAKLAGISNKQRRQCVKGIRFGWDAAISHTAKPKSAKKNNPIPSETQDEVAKDTIHGLDAGFILGPFKQDNPWAKETITSPLGMVDKKGGKHRVVHDLSHGKKQGTSVNYFIPKNKTYVKYVQTQQIVRMVAKLGIGAHLWVVDMAEAYRRVLLQQKYHKFLGFKWLGLTFRYICLPFGLSTSPKIYSDFAECLRQIVVRSHFTLFHPFGTVALLNYLDDFFGGHPDLTKAWKQYQLFKLWLIYLGIPTQDRKCSSPAIQAIILGFLYNTVTQMLSIPPAKLKTILQAINELLKAKKVSRRQIATVTGKLNWACKVVFGGRSMIRSLELAQLIKKHWDAKVIRLPRSAKNDLLWWKQILQSKYMQIPFKYLIMEPSEANIHVWTDASGSNKLGLGAYNSLGQYFQIKWTDLSLDYGRNTNDSSFPEFLAMVTAAYHWRNEFSNKVVHFHCDNSATVGFVITRSTPRNRPDLLNLARWLTVVALRFRFYFWITHIPGILNIEADNLSRFKKKPFNRLFFHANGIRMEPMDKYTQPFFDFNPNFDSSFQFNAQLAITSAHTILHGSPTDYLT